jgi:hypothetical protein
MEAKHKLKLLKSSAFIFGCVVLLQSKECSETTSCCEKRGGGVQKGGVKKCKMVVKTGKTVVKKKTIHCCKTMYVTGCFTSRNIGSHPIIACPVLLTLKRDPPERGTLIQEIQCTTAHYCRASKRLKHIH